MKRINEKTGTFFKYRDEREDGYLFEKYVYSKTNANGYFREIWRSPKGVAQKKNYDKQYSTTKIGRIANILSAVKIRAKNKNLECDLTAEYLNTIATDKCPVFGFDLAWGRESKDRPSGSQYDSPSLDRIKPNLGYVKGNVIWISMKANAIKNSATSDEIFKVASWLKELEDIS
jgi:sarcosine oxidase delta subunit